VYCGLTVQLLDVYIVLLCSVITLDVTHSWNMDHAPGNLILTGIKRSLTPSLFWIICRRKRFGPSQEPDNRARRTNVLDHPPFQSIPFFVLLQATHMPTLLSRGDRPWQVPRIKFQRITTSSEPNKAHNAWALSLKKTNFLLPSRGNLPVTPGRRHNTPLDLTNMNE
jgi:hypothetical protein